MAETKEKTEVKKEKVDTKKEEREYIIPLRKQVNKVPRYKKTNKAIKTIKEFLARHMKVPDRDLNKVKLDRYLNEAVWMRGIKKPPMKVRVKAAWDGEFVKVELAELPGKIKFKKERLEKREKKAEESGKKKKSVAAKPEEKSLEEKVEIEEKKKEESEKKAAVVEAGKAMEKAAAKQTKHQTRQPKNQPKRQQRMALQK